MLYVTKSFHHIPDIDKILKLLYFLIYSCNKKSEVMFRKRDAICKNRIQRVRINFPLYVTSNSQARDNFTCFVTSAIRYEYIHLFLRYRYKRITRRETKDISRLPKFGKQWKREFVALLKDQD